MTNELAPDDLVRMTKLIDEQISPFRKLGLTIVAVSMAAIVLGYFEYRHPHAIRLGDSGIPASSAVAWALGALLVVGGALLYSRHGDPRTHALFGQLVADRAAVTRVAVDRAINHKFDRFIVHTTKSETPVLLLVNRQDHGEIVTLFKRVYPQASR